MSERQIFYSTLLLVISLISSMVAAIVWRRRSAPGGKALVIFMVAMAWWSATYALFWMDIYPSRLFWLDVTYFGVVTVTPAFFIFVVQFSHREGWLNRPILALLIIQAVVTIILLWTDPWHGLFFAGKRNVTDSTIFAGGPWFWTNVIYSYSLYLFVVLLLFKSFLVSQALYRWQIGLMLLAAVIPWAANVISLTGLNPLSALDLTPIAFTLTGVLIAFSLFLYRFLDVVPVARDKLIEKMKDGILVVDNKGRVVDVNPALVELLGGEISSLIGRGIEEIIPEWSQLLVRSHGNDGIGQEILVQGNPPKYLNFRLIRLADRQQNEQGMLVILRDITVRKLLESEREKLINTLQDALGQVKTLKGLLPICANCKKIRDDQGYWQDVAVYIRDHSEAEFSHGICPDCMKSLYPEFVDKIGKSE